MPAKKQNRKKKRIQKRTPTTDPAQYARFLEMAKILETDESAAAFERALDAVVKKKKAPP